MTRKPEVLDRLAIGTAASSGIILAGCISALPASSCTAIAETYVLAILGFGLAGFMGGIAAILPKHVFELEGGEHFLTVIKHGLGDVFTLLAAYFFACAVASGSRNIQTATRSCYIGTQTELTERAHKRIKLVSPWYMFEILNSRTDIITH